MSESPAEEILVPAKVPVPIRAPVVKAAPEPSKAIDSLSVCVAPPDRSA